METAINTVVSAGASGIPHLYEWGGMVTLMTILIIASGFAIFGLCWVIWQMYQQNQKMFTESLKATTDFSNAVNELTAWVKGAQGRP